MASRLADLGQASEASQISPLPDREGPAQKGYTNAPCGRPPCILASLRLTRATGTLGSRTLSTVSVHIILHCRRFRRPGASLSVFWRLLHLINDRSCLCLLVLFTTTVGSDDCICLGDVSCLLYTSPSPRDATLSRMPSSA